MNMILLINRKFETNDPRSRFTMLLSMIIIIILHNLLIYHDEDHRGHSLVPEYLGLVHE